jgi:GNAT superfamily N-acetyltransferase
LPDALKIEPFERGDIPAFMELAAGEGWVAEEWEFEFLLEVSPQGCFCVRDDSGAGIAFVTAITHQHSGWIGNLIVARAHRRRGTGEALFGRALSALQSAGVKTIWLTASESGLSLYERHGFSRVDTVIRWTARGRKRHTGHTDRSDRSGSMGSPVSAAAIDCLAWGDRRDGLLGAVTGRGRLLPEEAGFMVIQPCDGAVQFGPFAALDSTTADRIFNEALGSVPCGTKVYIDAPASNRAAVRLFNRKALQVSGSTELMYAGVRPAYRPELLYGLATMGSCG